MINVLLIGLMLVAALVIWYFFMLPLGRQHHERELEMIRRKLARRAAMQDTRSAHSESGEEIR